MYINICLNLLGYLFGFSNISFRGRWSSVCVTRLPLMEEVHMFEVGSIFVETVDLIPSRVRFVVWSKDFSDI